MKNLKYFPFERNKYYYGKLLTEQDFIQEQSYMNDKRRMINRFIHGVGVAAGLNVVEVDEKSISVEAGLALDFSGREIVVDTPVMLRLSTIDSFEAVVEQGSRDYAYLCIEYEEHDIIPAHNVASGGMYQSGSTDYDKCREGYRLYLTDQEPDAQDGESFGTRRMILYQDSRIRITQRFPAFVKSGEEFETSILVENMGNGLKFSLELTEDLRCASVDGNSRLYAAWNDVLLERSGRQEKTFLLKAMAIQTGDVSLHLAPSGFKLSTESGEAVLESERTGTIPVTQKDVFDEMKERYYREAMEDVVRNNYPQGIYLAKIYLIRAEKTYLIERVENMPFEQYVHTGYLSRNTESILEKEIQKLVVKQIGENLSFVRPQRETEDSRNMGGQVSAHGTVDLNLGIGGKRGQRFFSHEIFHGLGLGNVSIDLSQQDENCTLHGSSEVFEDMEPKAELAAKLDITKGSFIIGARMVEATSRQTMTIHWRAVADQRAQPDSQEQRRLYIKPGRLEMKVRESTYLEAVCENMPGTTVLWSVKTKDGGKISQDGLYIAPNIPGVYEVTAQCLEAPELKSSLFIVVRE